MEKELLYLGIDVGSVSTNLVVINQDDKLIEKLYLRTGGQPINALKNGLEILSKKLNNYYDIKAFL